MMVLIKYKNFGFSLTISAFLILFFFSSVNPIIYKSNFKEISSLGQVSNGEQDYWPTDGWLTTVPEEQNMSSKTLSKIYD